MASMLEQIYRQVDSSPGRTYWNRVDVDGLPYRGGENPPILREEEYNERVQPVGTYNHEVFDLDEADQRERYCKIMTLSVNGLAQVYDRVFQEDKNRVILGWVQWQLEDQQPNRDSMMGPPQ